MSRDQKWLVVMIAVNEDELSSDGFPEGAEFGSIPDVLYAQIEAVAPGGSLDMDAVYLLSAAQKVRVSKILERTAIPYHEHAVDVRGESCLNAPCADHSPDCPVIPLDGRRVGR